MWLVMLVMMAAMEDTHTDGSHNTLTGSLEVGHLTLPSHVGCTAAVEICARDEIGALGRELAHSIRVTGRQLYRPYSQPYRLILIRLAPLPRGPGQAGLVWSLANGEVAGAGNSRAMKHDTLWH